MVNPREEAEGDASSPPTLSCSLEGATSGGENVETETKPKKGSAAMGNQEACVPRLGPVQGTLGGGAAVHPGEAAGDRGAGLRVRMARQADAGQVAPGGAGWPACQVGTHRNLTITAASRERARLQGRWCMGEEGWGHPEDHPESGGQRPAPGDSSSSGHRFASEL